MDDKKRTINTKAVSLSGVMIIVRLTSASKK
jgi:hypothetical protein